MKDFAGIIYIEKFSSVSPFGRNIEGIIY